MYVGGNYWAVGEVRGVGDGFARGGERWKYCRLTVYN